MSARIQKPLTTRTVLLVLFTVLLLGSCAGGSSPFSITRGSGEGGDIPDNGAVPSTLPGAIASPADVKTQSSEQYRSITTLTPLLTDSGSSQSAHYHHEDSIVSLGSTLTKGASE